MVYPIKRAFNRSIPLLLVLVAAPVWLVFAAAHAEGPKLPLEEIRNMLESEWIVSAEPDWDGVGDVAGLRTVLRSADPFADWSQPIEHDRGADSGHAVAGIGAELSIDAGRAFLFPRQAGPLARLGFSERLELLAIDGHDVAAADNVESIGRLLRGVPETPVSLTLASPAFGERWETRIFREPVRPLDVEVWHAGPVSILRIVEFNSRRTRSALLATVDLLGHSTRVGVLDLRSASGGDLHEALDAADALLPEGLDLLRMRTRCGKEQTAVSSVPGLASPQLVLLVGPDTASAAEIFAGVLQFHGRALLVGQRTRGKCSSQVVRRLSDGSHLRFTNLELSFPDSSSCSDAGLTPDKKWLAPDGVMSADLIAAVEHMVQGLEDILPNAGDAIVEHYRGDLGLQDPNSLRVLRAWGLLPARYDRLALDLHAMGTNLFDATPRIVRDILQEARSDPASPLKPHEAALSDLYDFLDAGGWYRGGPD